MRDTISYNKILYDAVLKAISQEDSNYKYGLKAFDDQFGGIFENEYFIWTGKSGTGKSTIVYDRVFFSIIDTLYEDVLNIIKLSGLSFNDFIERRKSKDADISELKNIIINYIRSKIYIRFFTLEISLEKIMFKMLVRYIYDLDKNDPYWGILDTRYVTGRRIKNKEIRESHLKRILNIIKSDVFSLKTFIMKECLYITDNTSDVNLILKKIDDDVNNVLQLEQDYSKSVFYLVCFDHIGLSTGDTEYNNIGILSKRFVKLRNEMTASVHLIQQTNPDRESKKTFAFMVPNYEDLRGNKATYQDADCVISLASPFNEGYDSIPYLDGTYMINPMAPQNNGFGLSDHLLIGKINKDRGGPSNIMISLGFIGNIGRIEDIFKPGTLTPGQEIDVYEKYMYNQPSYLDKNSIYYINKP